MSGNLRGLGPGVPALGYRLFDLLAARTRSVKVRLRVALDLRRTASARLDLISELLKPVGQRRLVHGGRVVLRLKEALLLKGAGQSVVPLGDIEDDGVGVELRRGVAINRPRSVVFELGGDETFPSSQRGGSRRREPGCTAPVR